MVETTKLDVQSITSAKVAIATLSEYNFADIVIKIIKNFDYAITITKIVDGAITTLKF